MKTIGRVAYEAFYDRSRLWDEVSEYDRERWERLAKAVAFAVEDAERKTLKCEGAPPRPRGVAPDYQHHFTCGRVPDPLYPSFLAKVRTEPA